MATHVIITGAPTTPGLNGSVPVRREIRDLQINYPQQWDLFCLGLLALQSTDESDQLSYYQIAGIHGRPYKAWNGVNGIDGQQSGYCTHSSILFLPWHRPYLCLFEQVLSKKIHDIADSYDEPLRSQYVSAANAFRLPYWDWGLQPQVGQPTFPSSIAGPAQIEITGTNGRKTSVRNPLLQYDFKNSTSGDFPDAPYNTWRATFRYPHDDSPKTTSQDALVNKAIASQLPTIRSQIRYCFGSISAFGPFSNDKWIQDNPGTYASLEDIHDNVHVLVGGPSPSNQSAPAGNMSNVPYAAFDPVFWLHHCNVDRMFAMFQVLHPDTYVESEPSSDGTFTEPPGYTETLTSDLTPFWKDASTFHTSETAKATTTLGYAYPETQPWNYATVPLYQKSVRTAIKKLYGTTISSSGAIPLPTKGSLSAAPGFQPQNGTPNSEPANIIHEINGENFTKSSALINSINMGAENDKQHENEDTSLLPRTSSKIINAIIKVEPLEQQDDGKLVNTVSTVAKDPITLFKDREWIINIRVQKHCLGGPFQIHCFLGPVPLNANTWLTHANNIGTCSILGSNLVTTSCDKCKVDASKGLIVTGVVPLTDALRDIILQGHLSSLRPSEIVPYLAKMLHWRVTTAEGTEKPREAVDDLQVSVVSTYVTISSEPDELPMYSGEYTLHPACTQGRPGGYNLGDQY